MFNRHRRERAKREARARKKIREAVGAKTYLSLFLSFREREIRYTISKNARSEANRLSRCCFPSPIHSDNTSLIYVYSSSSVRVPFHSLSFLALSLARARKKKNERDQKTNEGKCAQYTHTDAGARAHGENRIRIKSFSHPRLKTQRLCWALLFIIFEIVRVKLERTSPARARFLCCSRVSRDPSPHVFFFSFLRARKSDTLKM